MNRNNNIRGANTRGNSSFSNIQKNTNNLQNNKNNTQHISKKNLPMKVNSSAQNRTKGNAKDNTENNKIQNERIEMMFKLRKLWLDNVLWTRFFIISAISGMGDLQAVTKRLINNPTEFANIFKRFYSEENAKRFEALMMDHLLIGIKLINTAKTGNMASIKSLKEEWYKNADEISELLSSINSRWDKDKWQKLLHENLKLTEEQVMRRFRRQYTDDIIVYEKIENLSIKMADLMFEVIKMKVQ